MTALMVGVEEAVVGNMSEIKRCTFYRHFLIDFEIMIEVISNLKGRNATLSPSFYLHK